MIESSGFSQPTMLRSDAAAKAGNKGMSAEGEGYLGNVTVYTMTESGLALQATVKGTKFWVDKVAHGFLRVENHHYAVVFRT